MSKKSKNGIWVGENETYKFWLKVLSDLKSIDVQYVLITSICGLPGFKEAIAITFSKTEVQRCIVHVIKNSTRHLSHKDKKAFVADLKPTYQAIDSHKH